MPREHVFAQLPPGARAWMAVHGASMRPLLRGDEELYVHRCDAPELAPGDVAVLARDDGVLIAHLVTAAAPLVTSTFSGTVDAPGLRVVGRAERVRRSGLDVPLGKVARWATLALHRGWMFARKSTVMRTAYDLARELGGTEAAASLRERWLGDVRVQLASPADARDVAVFSSRFTTLPPEELADGIARGRIAVAWAGRRVVAMAAAGTGGRIRTDVMWLARGLRLEERLAQVLTSNPVVVEVRPHARAADVPAVHPDAMLERLGTHWIAATPDERMHQFTEPDGSVSPVAERVAELIDGQRTVRAIVDVLCDEFEVDRQTCESDTLRFIDTLVERKILTLTARASDPTPQSPPRPPEG